MKHIDVNNVEPIYEFIIVLCGAKYMQSCSDTLRAWRDKESNVNVNETLEEEWEKSFCCEENKQMIVGFVLHYIIDSMLFSCDTLSWVHNMICDPLMLPLMMCTFIELIYFLLIRVKDVPLARCYHTRLLYWLSTNTSSSSSSSQLLENHRSVALIYPKALEMWLATLHTFACVFTIPGCFMHHNVEWWLKMVQEELSPKYEKLQSESSLSKLLLSNVVHDLWYWQEVKEALHVFAFEQTDTNSNNDEKLEEQHSNIPIKKTLHKQNETNTLSALTIRCAVKRYLMEIVNEKCHEDKLNCLGNNHIGNFTNHEHQQSIKPFTTLSVHYNAELEKLELVRQRHHDPFMRFVKNNNNNNNVVQNENGQFNSEYDNDETHSSNNIIECVLQLNSDKMYVSKHVKKNVMRSLVNEMYNLVNFNRIELMESDHRNINNNLRNQDNKTELTSQLHPSERQDKENMSKIKKIKWWQHRIELDKEMEQIISKLEKLLFYNTNVSTNTITPFTNNNKINKTVDKETLERSKINAFSLAMFVGDVALAHRIQLWSFATEFVQKLKCYVTSQREHELEMNEYKEPEICLITDNYNQNTNDDDDSNVITAASHLFAILQAMPIFLSSYVSDKPSEYLQNNLEQSYHVEEENNCLANIEHQVLASLRQRRQHAKMKNNNNNERELYYAPQCSCEHCTLLVSECTICIERCMLEIIANTPNLSLNKESLEYTRMCSSLAIEVLTSFYDHLQECEPNESVEYDTTVNEIVEVIHVNLLCTPREHLYLMLDKYENLFVLPWEGLSILSHYSNSRVNDVMTVQLGQCQEEEYEEANGLRRQNLMEKREEETAIQMYLVIDPSSTCHLNKYEELMTMEDRPMWKIQHTNEIYKSKCNYPEQEEEFTQQSQQNETPYSFWSCELLPSNASGYVYIGHRRGEEIISRASLHDYISHWQFSHCENEHINGRYSCNSLPLLAMLMSCSSAKLCGNVKCDCTGMPLAFHEAGVMCFIGLLWEVTDGEVDKCTLKLLEHIRNNNNNNNSCFSKENSSTLKCTTEVTPCVTKRNKRKSNVTHIGTVMKTAQWKCILPFLSSAALVMYGYNLPLSIL